MRTQPASKENSAANLTPSIAPKMPWRVLEVKPLADYRLSVVFVDGTAGEVSLAALILGEKAGVFSALRDESLFAQVFVDHGAVTWPGELDLAPDAMYAEVRHAQK